MQHARTRGVLELAQHPGLDLADALARPDYAALEPAAAGEGGRPSLPVMEEAILPGVMNTVQ